MKLTLRNTTKLVEFNGVPARIWEGETERGVKVHAFITRIAVDKHEDCSVFEHELKEEFPPSPEIDSYPTSLVL